MILTEARSPFLNLGKSDIRTESAWFMVLEKATGSTLFCWVKYLIIMMIWNFWSVIPCSICSHFRAWPIFKKPPVSFESPTAAMTSYCSIPSIFIFQISAWMNWRHCRLNGSIFCISMMRLKKFQPPERVWSVSHVTSVYVSARGASIWGKTATAASHSTFDRVAEQPKGQGIGIWRACTTLLGDSQSIFKHQGMR